MRKGYRTGRGEKTGSKDKKSAGGRKGEAGRKKAHAGKSGVGQTENGKRLKIPEGGVGFVEGEADVPGFVIAPDDLCFGGTASFGMDEFYALMERKRSADNGHAAGVGNIHGDAVGVLAYGAIFPFDVKTNLRNDALVSAHFGPALFDIFFNGSGDRVCGHGVPRSEKGSTGEEQH
jgi:hypothetical protein